MNGIDEVEEFEDNLFLTEKDGKLTQELLLNDVFRDHIVSRNFKKIQELRDICQRSYIALHQNIQCGRKTNC